jgi:hypothetical protein
MTGKLLNRERNATNTSAQESCKKACPLLIDHLKITKNAPGKKGPQSSKEN